MAEAFMADRAPNMAGVTAHLTCDGAEKAIEQYKAGLGAEVLHIAPDDHGKLMHACIEVNGCAVFLHDTYPEMNALDPNGFGGASVKLHLSLKSHADVDTAYARAIGAGFETMMEPENQFWGDRYAMVKDSCGHIWTFGAPAGQ